MNKHLLLVILILFFIFQNSYSSYRADTKIKVYNNEYTLCVNLPKGFNSNKVYPLTLALHSCGCSGSDYCNALSGFCDSMQCIVISPENNYYGEISSKGLILVSLDSAFKKYKIDTTKVYFTGMSCNGVAVLKQGLAGVYPFKGIFPWDPYLASTSNKDFNFHSDIKTTLAIGTKDSKLNLVESFYDSLKFYNKKVNIVFAEGVGHELKFKTFTEEMIRCVKYINDNGSISINKLDNVKMRDYEVKFLSTEFTYTGNKDLNIITKSSNPVALPHPEVAIENNKITLRIDPEHVSEDELVYIVLEISEDNGSAIQQEVFKVEVKAITSEIEYKDSKVFSAYPIPAHDQLFFKSSENNISLEVTDITGKQILFENKYNTSMPLKIINFSKGVYLLTAKGNSFLKTIKFIVE